MNRLRKILANEHPPMLSALVWLRVAGVLLTLMTIGLAVVLATITRNNFETIGLYIDYVNLASTRLNYKASALLASQNLMFYGRSWVNMSEDTVNLQRAHIRGNTTAFIDTHMLMRSLEREADTSWAWTTRYVTMLNPALPAGATYSQYTVINQLEIGLAFAALMSYLSSSSTMPDSAYVAYSDGCALGEPHLASMNVDYMRGGNGHEVLAAAVQFGFDGILSKLNSVGETQFQVFLGMILTTGFVAFIIFVPIIVRLDLAGDRIMLQFVAIPAPVRKVLFETAAKRMHLLRRDYADEDDDSDNDADFDLDSEKVQVNDIETMVAGDEAGGATIDEDDDGSGSNGALALALLDVPNDASTVLSGESALSRSLPAIGEVDVAAAVNSTLIASSKNVPLTAKAARKRALRLATSSYRKNASTFFKLMFRFVSPLLLLVILFSTVYFTFLTQEKKMQELSSIVVAAGVRASCSRQAVVDLRKLSSLTTDAYYIYRSFFFTMSALDCVRVQVQLLGSGTISPIIADMPFVPFVGSPENGLPSSLSAATTVIVHDAMYGNACTFLEEHSEADFFNVSRCEEFGGGILKLGLAATAEMWWTEGYTVADRQLKGVFRENRLFEGRGWSLHTKDFNYSTVVCEVALGCSPNVLSPPLRTGIMGPTFISDPSYKGDVPDTALPGDGTTFLVAGTGPYWVSTEINSVGVKFMEESDALYLTPGLRALERIYLAEARNSSESFLTFITLFVPFFVSLFTLITLVWFLPETTRENRSMQTKRAMLLYLPIIVVSKIKSIKRLVDDIISGDAAASLGNAQTVMSSTTGKRSNSSKVRPR